MTIDKPAILGGEREFSSWIPIIKPNLDRYKEEISLKMEKVLETNMVSGVNILVKELEDELTRLLNVDHVIAVSSCTVGMILAIQANNLRQKEILVPSYSFSATAHMLYWNNNIVRFIDCHPTTFNISLEDLQKRLTPKTKAVLGVHMYGNPCLIDQLEDFSEDNNIPILFDAAHALGSSYKNKPIASQGLANSFSASPTKLFTTIEGGFLTTNDEKIAANVSRGRNYGNYADYSCKKPGLNARMSEIHAAVGLVTLPDISTFVKNRNRYVQIYQKELKGVPGVAFQEITPNGMSTYKDFSILIDSKNFGIDRNLVAEALKAENIATKFYFYPPIHQMEAYRIPNQNDFPITTKLSSSVLSLPIHNFMDEKEVTRIAQCIKSIQYHADKIKASSR